MKEESARGTSGRERERSRKKRRDGREGVENARGEARLVLRERDQLAPSLRLASSRIKARILPEPGRSARPQCGIVLKSDSIWAPLKITLNKLFGQFINPLGARASLALPPLRREKSRSFGFERAQLRLNGRPSANGPAGDSSVYDEPGRYNQVVWILKSLY